MKKKNIFQRIGEKIYNIFVRENSTEQVNIIEEPKKNSIGPYIHTKGIHNRNTLFKPNPNLYIRTNCGYISNPEVFYDVYRTNYQFKTVIDQLIKRITALDVKFQKAYIKTNTIHKQMKVKRINNFITRQLNTLFGFNDIDDSIPGAHNFIKTLCSAFIDGKVIMKKVYKTIANGDYDLSSGYFEISKIELCESKLFDFLNDDENTLVYIGDGRGDYKELDGHQFIVHTNNGDNINPHGESVIGSSGYTLHRMLMEIIDDFTAFSKRHGYPSMEVIGKGFTDKLTGQYYRVDDTIMKESMEIASNLVNGSTIAHSEDVEIKQIKDESGSFDYIKSLEWVERAITKQVVGSTTLVQNSELNGSRSLGEVHEHATLAIIEDGAKGCEKTLNKLLIDLLKLNGLYDEDIIMPSISIEYRKEDINTIEVDYTIKAIEQGSPVFVEDFMNKVGLRLPSDFDPNLTFNGYYNTDGDYKEGLFDKTKVKEISNNEQEGLIE